MSGIAKTNKNIGPSHCIDHCIEYCLFYYILARSSL